jgi:hypothetical protein
MMSDQSQMMQRQRIIWLLSQHLTIKPLRLPQPPGLVMSYGDVVRFFDVQKVTIVRCVASPRYFVSMEGEAFLLKIFVG